MLAFQPGHIFLVLLGLTSPKGPQSQDPVKHPSLAGEAGHTRNEAACCLPKGPTPTKPWAGVEDAPKERPLPDAPTPEAGVF